MLQCPVTCGGGGIQYRMVACQLPSSQTVPEANCDKLQRPPNSQPCGMLPCPGEHRWQRGAWSSVGHFHTISTYVLNRLSWVKPWASLSYKLAACRVWYVKFSTPIWVWHFADVGTLQKLQTMPQLMCIHAQAPTLHPKVLPFHL